MNERDRNPTWVNALNKLPPNTVPLVFGGLAMASGTTACSSEYVEKAKIEAVNCLCGVGACLSVATFGAAVVGWIIVPGRIAEAKERLELQDLLEHNYIRPDDPRVKAHVNRFFGRRDYPTGVQELMEYQPSIPMRIGIYFSESAESARREEPPEEELQEENSNEESAEE